MKQTDYLPLFTDGLCPVCGGWMNLPGAPGLYTPEMCPACTLEPLLPGLSSALHHRHVKARPDFHFRSVLKWADASKATMIEFLLDKTSIIRLGNNLALEAEVLDTEDPDPVNKLCRNESAAGGQASRASNKRLFTEIYPVLRSRYAHSCAYCQNMLPESPLADLDVPIPVGMVHTHISQTEKTAFWRAMLAVNAVAPVCWACNKRKGNAEQRGNQLYRTMLVKYKFSPQRPALQRLAGQRDLFDSQRYQRYEVIKVGKKQGTHTETELRAVGGMLTSVALRFAKPCQHCATHLFVTYLPAFRTVYFSCIHCNQHLRDYWTKSGQVMYALGTLSRPEAAAKAERARDAAYLKFRQKKLPKVLPTEAAGV